MKVNKSFPINFNVSESVDDRFMKVSIKLMHLEENLNNSYFTKDSVMRALPTLANTPILGYISEDQYGKEFNGHETELVIKDGEFFFKYIGSAYGVIPESCNPRFEIENGKEYLVVDGLMWRKFDDAVDILEDNGENSQSMELHDKYTGFFREDGLFQFEDFAFYGACILGDSRGVQPAMVGANITPVFSSKFQAEIDEKLKEYQALFEKHLNQTEEVNVNMTLEQLLAKYSLSTEDLTAKGIVAEDFSIEELEEKIKEFTNEGDESQAETEVEVEEASEGETEAEFEAEEKPETEAEAEQEFEANGGEEAPAGEGNEQPAEEFEVAEGKVVHKFALSHDDIRNSLYGQLRDYVEANELGERWDFWINKVYDDHFIMEHEGDGSFYKVGYSKENDAITLGTNVKVFASFLTAEEKGALELMRSNYAKLEEENATLKQFQAEAQKDEHQAKVEALFSQFSKLDESDYSDLREKMHEYSVEDIEEKLFARLGRKQANFSAKPKETNKLPLPPEGHKDTPDAYGGLFSKHLNSK